MQRWLSDPTSFHDQAEPTIKTNFFGTLHLTTQLLPLLKASSSLSKTPSRIVNVASQAGLLRILRNSQFRYNQFTNPALTLSELESLMNEFITDVKSGNHESKGWPNTCYGMSKLGVIAMTKVLSKNEPNLLINCCCPGYCATDMSSHRGTRTAEEGARTPSFLAVAPVTTTGKFYYDGREIDW